MDSTVRKYKYPVLNVSKLILASVQISVGCVKDSHFKAMHLYGM